VKFAQKNANEGKNVPAGILATTPFCRLPANLKQGLPSSFFKRVAAGAQQNKD